MSPPPPPPQPPFASIPSAPPYALAPHRFPFRALAAQAGRAPIGGGGAREVALACLMAARLAAGVRVTATLPADGRAARAASARAWFASIALPAALRAPIARLADALSGTDAEAVAAALGAVLAAARRHLDGASSAEMEQLIRALRPAET